MHERLLPAAAGGGRVHLDPELRHAAGLRSLLQPGAQWARWLLHCAASRRLLALRCLHGRPGLRNRPLREQGRWHAAMLLAMHRHQRRDVLGRWQQLPGDRQSHDDRRYRDDGREGLFSVVEAAKPAFRRFLRMPSSRVRRSAPGMAWDATRDFPGVPRPGIRGAWSSIIPDSAHAFPGPIPGWTPGVDADVGSRVYELVGEKPVPCGSI